MHNLVFKNRRLMEYTYYDDNDDDFFMGALPIFPSMMIDCYYCYYLVSWGCSPYPSGDVGALR